MKFQELKQEDKQEASNLLKLHWKKNLLYPKEYILNYLQQGYRLEIKQHDFFTLKENSTLISIFSIIKYEQDLAEIKDIVMKEEHKKTYFKEVIKYAITWSQKNKVRKLITLTLPENRSIFNQFNFKEEGYLRSHYTEKEDLILLSLFIKKEKQISLKDELEIIGIEKETRERLRKLPTN